MSTMAVLEVAIGLVFVFLLVSLLVSVVQELIASAIAWRARNLRSGIGTMLEDPMLQGLAGKLYAHPLVATLAQPGQLPSYIPSTIFARALVDILKTSPPAAGTALAFLQRETAGDADALRAELAGWFDDMMERVSGWYRRRVQVVLLAIGLAISALLDISTLRIADALWTTPPLRAAVAAQAETFYRTQAPDAAKPASIETFRRQIDELKLPIGWTDRRWSEVFGRDAEGRWWPLLAAVAGWLLTAFAASLGTQFWFNILGEALKLRAAGRKPATAEQKGTTAQADVVSAAP
ncbi:MAG: hypothetical protein IT561_00595 [Alphaproteobacteria bacterium]|nr:hypothetical protein [Alphaproteobacteria bacterium]